MAVNRGACRDFGRDFFVHGKLKIRRLIFFGDCVQRIRNFGRRRSWIRSHDPDSGFEHRADERGITDDDFTAFLMRAYDLTEFFQTIQPLPFSSHLDDHQKFSNIYHILDLK